MNRPHGNKGKVRSPELRARLSAANRGKPGHSHTAETRAILRAKATGRKHSAETVAKMRAISTGKKQSAEARAKTSAALKGHAVSAETRAKISATMIKRGTTAGRNSSFFGQTNSRSWRGKMGEYGGAMMRSSWERRFAAALDRRGIVWTYEPQRFDLGEITYLPDFYVPEFGAHVEVKGWMDPNSQRRIGLFREKYPELPLIVVNGELLRQFETLF